MAEAAPRKALKKRMPKDIKICGRKFQIAWGKGNIGGQFHTVHPKTGGGLIILGEGPTDEYYQLTNVVHELLEIILTLRNIRYYEADDKILFSMNHGEFTEVCLALSRALIDANLVKVKEVGDK